ncbi:MAG: NfeD family protein [Thermoprotei archaeon]
MISSFHMKNTLYYILLFQLFIICSELFTTHVYSDNLSNTVIIAKLNVPIDPGSSHFVERVVNYAINQKAVAIVIEMNTPGGLLNDMISIIASITKANQSGIPTYTFVIPNGMAASAGSYIAMATNKIIMGPGSVIGPSTPIVIGGTPLEQNHTQAAMLKLMVSLTQKWGRNSTAAYSMVQGDQAFSADEALKFHIIDAIAKSLNDALDKLGLSGYQQIVINEDLYEQFISTLSNPVLDGILILIGVLAIVVDIYHPTIILTVVGAIAVIAGLIGAEVINASLLGFFILAIAAFLIILELKLGHGLAIMAGVALGVVGILYLANGLAYSPSPITFTTDLILFLIVIIGIVVGLYIRWIVGPIKKRAKLTGPESLIGQTGIAVTDLKPEGEVKIEGIIWRAKSISGDILKNETVKVKDIKNLTLIVEKTTELSEK